MKFAINDEKRRIFEEISSKLLRGNVYLVGGFVRDTLLGRETTDMDFCCSLLPEEIHALFPDSLYFKKFGTVSFKYANINVTIASLRTEKDYTDYRHPSKVCFVKSIYEDFVRRDFTINAIYVDSNFELIDPTGRGINDLTNKTICIIGDSMTRFHEDPLRILRACRFKYELQFCYEKSLEDAILKCEELIAYLNPQKIMEELHKCPSEYQKNMIEELHLRKYLAV